MAGQPPAQQRLGTDHSPVAQIHLGLVQHDELVALEGAAQLALQHEPLHRRRIHVRHIERPSVAAVLLGVVHRRVGVADQVDRVLRVVRADGDADARGQIDFLLVHVKRAADLVEECAGESPEAWAVVEIRGQAVHEHRELIACQATDHGVLAEHARESLAQDLERAIPGRMTERVVDVLEAVEVEIEQGERMLAASRARDGLLQQVLELHSVRHLGQRVVAREITDAPLGSLALGDVARDVDVALELWVERRDARGGHGYRDGLSGRGAQHGLARLGRRAAEIEGAAVGLVDEAAERLAHQVRVAVAEKALRRLVAALDDAVRRSDDYRVAQAVEHRVEIILGDGGLAELLPHALERMLQLAEIIAARDMEGTGVVAFPDAVRRADERRDRPGPPAGEEPSSGQGQKDHGQGHSREHGPHAPQLAALLVLQLDANAGERRLHLRPAHPDLERPRALRRRRNPGRYAVGDHQRIRCRTALGGAIALDLRVAGAEQQHSARIRYLDALDVVLLEEASGDRGYGRIVVCNQRGRKQRAGDVDHAPAARLQIALEFLLDGRVGEPGDVGAVDPMLVIGEATEQEREPDAHAEGEQ